MKFQYKVIIMSVLCCLLIVFISIQYISSDQYKTTVVFKTKQGNVSIQCRNADDDESRIRGLLDVTYLEQNKGMLFSYLSAEPKVFTMKGMKIPLDIIFIDQNFTVMRVVEADIGEEFIRSIYPVQFVVEINQGFAKKKDIETGSQVEIKNFT